MSFFNWRKLNFFDISKDVDAGVVSKNLGEFQISCTTSGRGNLIVGDTGGNIWVYNRHWESTRLTQNEGSVIQLVLPRQSNYLFGLSEIKGVRCLKVWDLEKEFGNNQVRVSDLSLAGNPSDPVCLTVNDNLQLLAVGYQNGAVVLYRGDSTKEKGTKQKFLLEKGDMVSGLSFIVTSSAILLYLATTKDVFLFNVTVKDRETKLLLDNLGCEPGLAISTSNFPDAHFITGQRDALYFYNPEGRGQCYVFEGKKKVMKWFRGYLSVATEEGNGKDSITIFDVQNKVICFSAPVRHIFSLSAEWGTLLLISSDGKIIQLQEKDLQSKLDLLFKKNFYDVAVKVARGQNLDKEGLVDIYRQYGDHLYDKGDHSGAIDQYEKTIGCLEPSYVIRKFLDTQKIHNLTAYLQALHRKGEATEDHTTLLLNCYTKLKDSKNLDEFIMTKDREVDFDVDIAISVCRQAGYFRHALALAEKHKKHDLYLKIQIDDEKDYENALNYISSLSPAQAEEELSVYGNILIEKLPKQTTNILKDLVSKECQRPELFIPFFIKTREGMLDYLEHVVHVRKLVPPQVWNTLLEYNLHTYKTLENPADLKIREEKIMQILTSDTSNYDPDQALVLCQLNHFSPGFLYLYQRCGLHEEILRYHFEAGNYEAGILACRRFGPQNPNLWVTALQSVAASGVEVPQNYFKEVLENIEKNRLLSPLLVVTTLSSCPTASLGVVRDYLLRTLRVEETNIQEDTRILEQYRRDTEALRETIHGLRTEAVVFQSTKCSACNNTLEIPTVYFLCQHGYHQHCFQSLADNEQECPKCQEENKKILDIIKSQDAARNQHDQFHAQLEKAENGFSIVAEYFGRGLFSTPPSLQPINQGSGSGRDLNQAQGQAQGIAENMSSLNLSEGRMRAGERTGLTASVQESEGRLRQAAGSAGRRFEEKSEGRMRSEIKGGRLDVEQSEGRLRADMRGAGVKPNLENEARLRAGQSSQVPMNTPSDARLRMGEGSRLSGSLNSNITRQKMERRSPTGYGFQEQTISKDRISPQNPFGSPDSGESLSESNPFAEKQVKQSRPSSHLSSSVGRAKGGGGAENPFGGGGGGVENPFGEDYDDELNPFAD